MSLYLVLSVVCIMRCASECILPGQVTFELTVAVQWALEMLQHACLSVFTWSASAARVVLYGA